MRILFMGNNRLGLDVLQWLVQEKSDDIVGLVVHPPERGRCRQEIVEASGLGASNIWDGSRLGEPEVLEAIGRRRPDIGLSVLFGHILTARFTSLFPQECVNLHPSYLPWNRGACPNVWSIVDGTPAGVTLHYIDEGIDTGDIISQSRVELSPADTGKTLYEKLEREGLELFKRTWPEIRLGKNARSPQPAGGTRHALRDVRDIDEIDLEGVCRAGELLDVLRARTFPPYRGAYFVQGGKKVFLELHMTTEESPEDAQPDE